MKLPRLNRWDVIWAAGVLALFLSIGVASGTPFYGLYAVLLGTVMLLLAISEWHDKGHAWIPTLSWTIPFGSLWLASLWLFEGRRGVVFVVGSVAIMVMTVSTRAAARWYEIVLRRPFKT
jgi:hypothetical protein